jgi:hypothetical protein
VVLGAFSVHGMGLGEAHISERVSNSNPQPLPVHHVKEQL